MQNDKICPQPSSTVHSHAIRILLFGIFFGLCGETMRENPKYPIYGYMDTPRGVLARANQLGTLTRAGPRESSQKQQRQKSYPKAHDMVPFRFALSCLGTCSSQADANNPPERPTGVRGAPT